jgi:membrane-bound serine protease (ClpP class)
VRRLPRSLGLLGILLVAVGMWLPARAEAQTAPQVSDTVDVIQVNGYLDPVLVGFIERAVDQAERDHDVALVLQMDSPGAVVSTQRLTSLIGRIRNASITVGVWVGPSGAEAVGGAADVLAAADYRALAPESKLDIGGRRIGAAEALETGKTNVGAECNRDRGSTEGCAATVGDFIVSLPGVETRTIEQDGQTRVEPTGQTRFSQLSLVDRLMHTVASPPVAYLCFVMGMALLLFELFTAGVGVAGVVGAGAFVLGCYGLAVLPTRPAAALLLVFAMVGYGIDVQTGVPRLWTGLATAAFVLGSVLLYDGVSLSWITLLAGVIGMTVAMLAGMPAMVRTRFSTPTIGREWMLGEEGQARTAIDPDGVVVVRGAPWRARTNRATPLRAGDPLRVAAIEGLLLEVEPLVGAAKDHRASSEPGDNLENRA